MRLMRESSEYPLLPAIFSVQPPRCLQTVNDIVKPNAIAMPRAQSHGNAPAQPYLSHLRSLENDAEGVDP